MCCTRLAENTGRKKVAKKRHLDTIAEICCAISSQLRHILTVRKNVLSSNMSSRCPHNMVNFGVLTAEIVSLVWGTPANFNGFCVLAALLHGTLVVGVSQTAAFNGGCHLYSTGRPSGWAFAHISSLSFFPRLISAIGDWMSTTLPHMMWPKCEFRMRVWYVLHAAHWKYRTQKLRQKSPSANHRTTLSGHIFATKAMYRRSEKNC